MADFIRPAGGLSAADKDTARQWMVAGHSILNGKVAGEIPSKAAANAGNCLLTGGQLALCDFPTGYYAPGNETNTPGIYIDQTAVASAIGLTAEKLKPGESVLGITGAVVSFSKSFAYTGNVQTCAIPITGYYELIAYGAQGGTGGSAYDPSPGRNGGTGGYGGHIKAVVYIIQNDVITVKVGGMGGRGVDWNGPGGSGGYADGSNGSYGQLGIDARMGGGGGGGGSTNFYSANKAATLCSANGGGGGSGGMYLFNCGGYSGAGGKGGGATGGAGAPSATLSSGTHAARDGLGGSGGGYTSTEHLVSVTGATGQRAGNGSATINYIGKTPVG